VSDLVEGIHKSDSTTAAWREEIKLSIQRVGGPRKADWQAIGTIVGFIVLAGAVWIRPVELQGAYLRDQMKELGHEFKNHCALPLHREGQVRIDALEKVVLEKAAYNAAGIRELDAKLQKEYQLMDASVRERVGAVEHEVRERWVVDRSGIEKIADKTEKTLNRIAVLETLLDIKNHKTP
jgi:hypothetical protein